jgi:hypothetical protein
LPVGRSGKRGPSRRQRRSFYVDEDVSRILDKLGWDGPWYERLRLAMLDPILRARDSEPKLVETVVDLVGMRMLVLDGMQVGPKPSIAQKP